MKEKLSAGGVGRNDNSRTTMGVDPQLLLRTSYFTGSRSSFSCFLYRVFSCIVCFSCLVCALRCVHCVLFDCVHRALFCAARHTSVSLLREKQADNKQRSATNLSWRLSFLHSGFLLSFDVQRRIELLLCFSFSLSLKVSFPPQFLSFLSFFHS